MSTTRTIKVKRGISGGTPNLQYGHASGKANSANTKPQTRATERTDR